MENEQIHYWLGQRKEPDDVFSIMKLDEAGDKLFEQPQLLIKWVQYVDDFHKEYPDIATPLFFRLLERYEEETLVHMLIAAKDVPSTEDIAVRIQAELTQHWLDIRKHSADIFTLLNFGKNTLFESPLFTAWMKYVDDFNVKQPQDEKVSLLSTLRVLYGDATFDDMLHHANKSPSTDCLTKELQDQIMMSWFLEKLDPSSARKKAESMNPQEDRVYGNAEINALRNYPEYFRSETIMDNAVFTMREKFGDNQLAKMLVEELKSDKKPKAYFYKMLKALIDVWLDEKQATSVVGKWLRVEKTTTVFLKNVYKTYKKTYDSRYPEQQQSKKSTYSEKTKSKKSSRKRKRHADA